MLYCAGHRKFQHEQGKWVPWHVGTCGPTGATCSSKQSVTESDSAKCGCLHTREILKEALVLGRDCTGLFLGPFLHWESNCRLPSCLKRIVRSDQGSEKINDREKKQTRARTFSLSRTWLVVIFSKCYLASSLLKQFLHRMNNLTCLIHWAVLSTALSKVKESLFMKSLFSLLPYFVCHITYILM